MSSDTHGAYGVIVAQELVELLDSEHNRIGTHYLVLFPPTSTSM